MKKVAIKTTKQYSKIVLTGLLPLFFLASCLSPEFEYYGLEVQARGLDSNESITVSNGSSLVVTGNRDLEWTEPQKFKKGYRNDRTEYRVSIIRQPSNSNKVCRPLNPTGNMSKSIQIVRIECGFPLVVADTNMTMTTSNGLIISNQYEERALNASRTLVTSLLHEVKQDPTSSDKEDKKLKVTPMDLMGSTAFKKLYMEGEAITLTHKSVEQGCEISGANFNSGLTMKFPTEDTFMDTVQTVALDKDWIDESDSLSEGRTCADFSRFDEYFLDYNEEENNKNEKAYTASCYPAPMVTVDCGLALKLKVTGLADGETISVTATRTSGSVNAHEVEYSSNGKKTFNIAFQDGDDFVIDIVPGSAPAGKTCLFDNFGIPGSQSIQSFSSSNYTEILRCS